MGGVGWVGSDGWDRMRFRRVGIQRWTHSSETSQKLAVTQLRGVGTQSSTCGAIRYAMRSHATLSHATLCEGVNKVQAMEHSWNPRGLGFRVEDGGGEGMMEWDEPMVSE